MIIHKIITNNHLNLNVSYGQISQKFSILNNKLNTCFSFEVEVSPFAIRRLLSTGHSLGLRPSGMFSNTRGLRMDNVLPLSNKASIGIPHTSTLINIPFSSMDLALVVGLSSLTSIHVAET